MRYIGACLQHPLPDACLRNGLHTVLFGWLLQYR